MAKESQLHEYGKMLFEDAAGQTLRLPQCESPRFCPPEAFSVARVEFEKGIPWAGYAGRQPDIVLTSTFGTKLVIEIKNSSGKDSNYISAMEQAGFTLILELDVSTWRNYPELRPNFSEPAWLSNVMVQARWLSPGKAFHCEWEQYREGHHVYDTAMPSEEFERRCIEASSNGDPISISLGPVDRRPDYLGWQIENGWVLCRGGKRLEDFCVREIGGTEFQAVDHGGKLGPPAGSFMRFEKYPGMMPDLWMGPLRTAPTEWRLAVDDVFSHVAPNAKSIY